MKFLRVVSRATVALRLTLALHAGAAEKRAETVFTDVAGQPHRLPGRDECRALVLFFIAHDCPMSNGYAPEITRICQAFTPRGAAFRVVYAERDLAAADAARHAREFAFPCPAILDRDLRLAARAGATMTPEAAVLSPEGAVLYLGRIDDLYADYGKKRAQPEHRDLREAIEAVLAGRAVPQARTFGLGCQIDFSPNSSNTK
ncbi:MAG: hypothetical protein ABIZ56_13075 [Chthoniobacteraceae bacterium]